MLICDRYEATGDMTAGGMSLTYVCDDVRLDRKVVIKTLKNEADIKRLRDEQKALLKIRSNHVVQLLDIISFERLGRRFDCLVLEHIDGTDLQEGAYDVGHSYVSVLWQVAKGLEEIHNAGVIHRDIKPNNVRINDEGIAKIIDFGLSREAGVDNVTQSAHGYLPYMPPELLTRPPIKFTKASDVYSFAVLALAISKAGLPACLKMVPPAPSADLYAHHLENLDLELSSTMQRCLAPRPEDRPAISEVLEKLERVLLRDRHRARIVVGGTVSEISANKRIARPNVKSGTEVVAQIEIKYDGNSFVIGSTVGDVKVNNNKAEQGMPLPLSCVLAFAAAGRSYYATFDVSNPEFMP